MSSGHIFVLCMMAISMFGGALHMWAKGASGQSIESRRSRRAARLSGADELEAERKILLLSSENERLTGQVSRLEERLAVLERIATDPAERVAREIDALR